VDRGALPAQSVFLTGETREAYLAAAPADDANFIATFAHLLKHTGGYARGDAQRVASSSMRELAEWVIIGKKMSLG
jgi:hypothetical protein